MDALATGNGKVVAMAAAEGSRMQGLVVAEAAGDGGGVGSGRRPAVRKGGICGGGRRATWLSSVVCQIDSKRELKPRPNGPRGQTSPLHVQNSESAHISLSICFF